MEACIDGSGLPGVDPGPGQEGDEGTDQCVCCVVDGDCDDGVFCNGAETCVANTCQPGTGPCTDPALSVCDETDDECVECLLDGQCAANPNGPFWKVGPAICDACPASPHWPAGSFANGRAACRATARQARTAARPDGNPLLSRELNEIPSH